MNVQTVPGDSRVVPTMRRPPQRWSVVIAHATVLTVLPSGIWRIFVGLGFNMGFSDEFWGPHLPGWGTAYVVGLSLVAEGIALLTLGLVQPWGEVVPRWIPLLGGRRVAPWTAIAAATFGSLALIAIWSPLVTAFGDAPGSDQPSGWWGLLMAACYLPLIAWGPMLLAVTAAYAIRHYFVADRRAAESIWGR